MAQLRRAEDGHLYILAGPNQGTWQINEEGIIWLKSNKYPLPTYRDSTYLSAGTYRKLQDKGFLFTKGWLTGLQDSEIDVEDTTQPFETGLPMFLIWREGEPKWAISILLSELTNDKNIRTEIKQTNAKFLFFRGVAKSRQIPVSNLYNAFYCAGVAPQTNSYRVFWQDQSGKEHKSRYAPQTPGFNDMWQGNVFLERRQNNQTMWKRYLPGSTASVSDSVLWLAKEGNDPEWPGIGTKIGEPINDWQLWRLSVSEDNPIEWTSIKNWFGYRDITAIPPYHGIHLVNPMGSVTPDGGYSCASEHRVFVQVVPSSREMEGIDRQAYLASKLVDSGIATRLVTSQIAPIPVPTNEISYFRWYAPQSGRYRIRLKGDAFTRPIDIQINPSFSKTPYWLQELTCIVQSPRGKQELRAFGYKDTVHVSDTATVLNNCTRDELEQITWSYEPFRLPVYVSWYSIAGQKRIGQESGKNVHSADELTACWRERIWAKWPADSILHLTLNAGSFGLIELEVTAKPELHARQDAIAISKQTVEQKEVVAPKHTIKQEAIVVSKSSAEPMQESPTWLVNEHVTRMVIWYSQAMNWRNQERKPLPAALRANLLQLRNQAEAQPELYVALDRLARAKDMQYWLLVRMQMLVDELHQFLRLSENTR